MGGATTRVATGRQATPASPSIRGGSEDRTRTPVWAFRFRDGCRRRPSAGPSKCEVRRAGLEPARPRGTWSTARRACPLPNRRMCRSAGIPDVSAVGRCGDRKPLPQCGSGSCLMLSTIEFALTPHRWGLSRERCPHGHVTVSPVPRRFAGLSTSSRVRCPWDLPRFAWTEGIEPPAAGFGDRCSSS